jgi:hypothetical protein
MKIEQNTSWEANSRSADQDISTFCGTRRLIPVFIWAHNTIPSLARWILFIPPQMAKKSSLVYGARRFVIVLTKVLHWALYWPRWMMSTPSYTTFYCLFQYYLPNHAKVSRYVSYSEAFQLKFTAIRVSQPVVRVPLGARERIMGVGGYTNANENSELFTLYPLVHS